MKPWVKYSLIRLGVFAVAFILLMITGVVDWWLSAIIAAILSFCIAYVFFGKLRDEVALELQTRRAGARSSDADAESEDRVF